MRMRRPLWFLTGVLLGGLAIGFGLLRPLNAPRPSWPRHLPEVRKVLRNHLGFVPRHLRIEDTTDLTGDGIPEALVAFSEGATIEKIAVIGLRGGQPVWLLAEEGPRMTPLTLRRGGGGAGRYGSTFWITPSGWIVQGTYHVAETSARWCHVQAYRWDSSRERFVTVPRDALQPLKDRYCRTLCRSMLTSPLRDAFIAPCSRLGLD